MVSCLFGSKNVAKYPLHVILGWPASEAYLLCAPVFHSYPQTVMYLRPAATDITYVDDLSASAHFGRSVVVVDSPQTTENIIGYVILAIAVALALVGFIAAVLIRRCCAYFREMRQHWRRRKARRRITSSPVSPTAPTEKARISTTTVLRPDHSEKTDTAFSPPPTNKVFADLPPYSHEHEINHHELSDNNNNGTVSSLVRSPSPVHVNVSKECSYYNIKNLSGK